MSSIKDIAKMCNVSVATVSKALNDKADIGEDELIVCDCGYGANV